MTPTTNLVLLLKAQKGEDSNDKYENKLTESGFTVKQVKTIDFTFKNLETLKKNLDTPDNFSGIIFTSPRCVSAVQLALNGERIGEEWNRKDNYVVGETTAAVAFNELELKCLGKDTGNANNLADLVLKEKERYAKPFLFPHGNLKTDIFKKRIENQLDLHEVYVYDTIPNPHIEQDLIAATENRTIIPEFIIFFSPSGITSSRQFLKKIQEIDKIKIIAIGPTTELALKEQGFRIHGTASQPTPEDLIAAMS